MSQYGYPNQVPPPQQGYGVPQQPGYGQHPGQHPGGQHPGQHPGGQYPGQRPGGQYPGQYPAPYPGQPGQPGYPPNQGWPAPAAGPNGEPLAEQGTRLAARLIDGLIIGGLSMLVFVPVIIVVVAASAGSTQVNEDGTVSGGGATFAMLLLVELGLFLFILAAQYVYEVEFAKRTGQTVGKRVMKIRIVPLAPQQPIGRGYLAKRWLVSGPGGLIPGLSLLNILWCLWDKPYRQCLHDKFANTVVVKVPG